MKKIITIFLVLITIFTLASCTVENNNLEKPVLTVENNKVSWKKVTDAVKYNVYVDDEEFSFTTNTSITFTTLDEGSYKVVVEALFSHTTSTSKSKPVTVVISKNVEITLSNPVITLEENKITWEKVENAQKYAVYIDDKEVGKVFNTSYIIGELSVGEHTVYIKAIYEDSKNNLSSISNKITFNVEDENKERIMNIFMINDTHGAFNNSDFPGLEKVNTIIKSLEKTNGEYIKVLNGDALQGSYVSSTQYGRPIIEALNVMKFDAFVIGNHEFDWGLEHIYKFKDGDLTNGEANFPFLGANIYDKKTNQRVDWIEPYTIVEKNGVKVGIIGIIGHTQESSILTPMVENYDFVYPLELVKQYSRELRVDKGCDAVVVSLHDFDEDLQGSILNLQLESRVDAILCGHTHRNEYYVGTNKAGAQVPVVQNRDKNQTATNLIVNLDSSTNPNHTFKRLYPSDYSDDAEVKEVIGRFQAVIDESRKVIGSSSSSINKSTLGVYAATAMKEAFDVDFGIINTGGIRATIGYGDITISEIFEALPFNNKVIIVTLSGRNILSACDDTYFYYSSGFSLNSIKSSSMYTVAIIDYVYYGSYNAALRNDTGYDSGVVARDLLIAYMDNIY